jgi:peptide/nickel transport system ATP-binding protein
MTTRQIARLDGVCVNIGGRRILSDISFSVPEGSAVALVGETGSGKSMTCRVLSGLLGRIGGEIVSGEAEFAGRSVVGYAERDWERIRGTEVALIPQSSMSSLNPVRTVASQLREAVRVIDPQRDTPDHLRELLDAVRLRDPERVLRSYAHELSGGMRQRVMIALALIGRPKLLIADEPTTALDVIVQRDILELISDLQRSQGLSLVLVTHDLGVARYLADGVVVMNKGKIVEKGAVTRTLVTPRHPYTKALLAAGPIHAEPGTRLPVLESEVAS